MPKTSTRWQANSPTGGPSSSPVVPPVLVWICAGIVAAAGSILMASYVACLWGNSCTASRFDRIFLVVLAVAAGLMAFGALAKFRVAPVAIGLTVACLAAFYLFEAVTPSPIEVHWQHLVEAVRHYREQGIDAAIGGRGTVRLADGSEAVSLGGPSNRLVVLCQEGDRPAMNYLADDKGFKNPTTSWTTAPHIVFVGDSFTQGVCVANGAHFVDAVREKFPGTVNLAYFGNGPLIELADLREYAPLLAPRYVFWMYTEENDLLPYFPPSDLDNELANPILAKYLEDPGFSQNLLARQTLVNAAVNAFADARAETAGEVGEGLQSYLTLAHTRDVLRDAYVRLRVAVRLPNPPLPPLTDERLAQFATILTMARDETARWGGRIVFVNLPSHRLACIGRDHPSRKSVLDVPVRLGLDMVDAEGPLFDLAEARGAHLISGDGRCGGHYSEAGYAVIAKLLLEYLRIAGGQDDLPPGWRWVVMADGSRQLIFTGAAHDRSHALRP
jgi:hypothetical protein